MWELHVISWKYICHNLAANSDGVNLPASIDESAITDKKSPKAFAWASQETVGL
jgi:hypothetical protein